MCVVCVCVRVCDGMQDRVGADGQPEPATVRQVLLRYGGLSEPDEAEPWMVTVCSQPELTEIHLRVQPVLIIIMPIVGAPPPLCVAVYHPLCPPCLCSAPVCLGGRRLTPSVRVRVRQELAVLREHLPPVAPVRTALLQLLRDPRCAAAAAEPLLEQAQVTPRALCRPSQPPDPRCGAPPGCMPGGLRVRGEIAGLLIIRSD